MATLALMWPILAVGTSVGFPQNQTCPSVVNPVVENGWTAYRAGLLDSARVEFDSAVERCPNHVGGQIGLAYSLLQLNELNPAETLFARVAAFQPENIDAALGLGLVAWRQGDIQRSEALFERALILEPDNQTAREFLARTGRVLGTPPARTPFVRPDSTVYHSRTHEGHFDVRGAAGWEPFYIKGVNLGAALPGRFATEFPDSITYATWIEQIGAMGANTIRVYTVHPPRFYDALARYNATHEDPLWLVHGVWATVPPDNDYDNEEWKAAFFREIHDVVDLIHGRADLPPRGDEGFRNYTSDVSRWVIGYVFGREWEPQTIAGFNRGRGGRSDWTGHHVGIRRGTPAEVWMTQATEEMIAYEMNTFSNQRPIAYTNWPTLDPLQHTSEATNAEEVRIATSVGASKYLDPEAPNQDDEALDVSRMFSTPLFPAGHFASYHAYPYHPDFMILDRDLLETRSPEGRSNYFGYLVNLKRHHADVPVLIAEYGVPASWGIAHFQPQGWHHGGLSEPDQATANARMTREIAAANMAGGILFSWIDEWFKRTWLVRPMILPEERNRLWYNRLDPEQHYGVVAMEPQPRLASRSAQDRRRAWQMVTPVLQRGDVSLRALADEAYLSLFFQGPNSSVPTPLYIGFDLATPGLGDRRWPGGVGPASPVGLEFVLQFDGASVQILADSAVNPWVVDPIYESVPRLEERSELDELSTQPPGTFQGRWQARANIPFQSVANEDGAYTSLRVVVRRHRFARDTTEYPATGYDRGVLPRGPAPDGAWELSPTEGTLEVRIPWMLINITDPSSRNMLSGADGQLGPFRSRPISGLNLTAVWQIDGSWIQLATDNFSQPTFSWDRWERPQWAARPRPLYQTMQDTFLNLDRTLRFDGHPR